MSITGLKEAASGKFSVTGPGLAAFNGWNR